MKNQQSKERAREEKNQDSLSSEKEHKHTDQKSKAVISIKDVIDKHPTSKNVHDMPQDEQQYDDSPKSKDE
ncbi:MAG: hypothetical protein ABIP95_16880 [Pelobium sp.]